MADLPKFPTFPALETPALTAPVLGRVLIGMDLVQIAGIDASLAHFGERFRQRLFSAHELAYASAAPGLLAERLAARFAAKEATLKALGMADQGIAWREIEVIKHPDGHCELCLHGKAQVFASQRNVQQLAVSLSHDGDYAAAIVMAVIGNASQALSPHFFDSL